MILMILIVIFKGVLCYVLPSLKKGVGTGRH